MSRAVARNERYTLAFGVDHTPMGCFFQLYEHAAKGEDPEADETECPQVDGDEMFGLKINNPKTLERNPKLGDILRGMGKQHLRNEESIVAIGKACGLDVEKKVYELWD